MTSLLPFTTDVIRAFGWTLMHSFWQAFVVFACLRIVLKIWPAASSAAKYHLSFLSLAGIFTWFVATFWRQLSALRGTGESVQLVLNAQLTAVPAAPPAALGVADSADIMPGMEVYFPVVVGIYIVGVTVMTIKLVLDLAQLQHIRKAALPQLSDAWDTQLKTLCGRLGIRKKVALHVCASIQVPVMIGFVKPLILLPAAMVNNLHTDQLEAILLHELAHIKRHDYLLNIFQSIVEAILFFNPFIWWISKNIRIEREHCCDDLVIASTVQPLHYAKALVALEEYRLTTNPMAMAIADNKQYLFHRIKRIMEMKTSHRSYSQQFLAVLIILTGVASIAWLNPAKKDPKEKEAAKEECLPVVTKPSLWQTTLTEDCAPAPAVATPGCAPTTLASVTCLPGAAVTTPAIDTTPGKITIINDKGEVKEYNSIAEMPEEDRVRMQEQFVKLQEQSKQLELQLAKQREQFKVNGEQMRHMREAMSLSQQNAIAAMKNIDWSKMQQAYSQVDWAKVQEDMKKAYSQVDWAKMQDEMKREFEKVDWSKMQKELADAYKNVDWEKVNKEMVDAYKNVDWAEVNKNMADAYKVFADHSNADIQAYTNALARRENEANRKISEMERKALERDREKRDQAFRDAHDRAMKSREESNRRASESRAEMNRSMGQRARLDEMLKAMEADKLLDTKKGYLVEKKDGALYINNVKQPDEVLKKYSKYLTGDKITLKGDGQ